MSRFRPLDLVLAAGLTVLAAAEGLFGLTVAASPWYVVATVPLVTLPVLARRDRPATALTLLLAGQLAQAALGSDLPGGLAEGLALILVLYAAAAHRPIRPAAALWSVASVAMAAVVTIAGEARPGNYVYVETVVAVAWLAGRGVRLAEERSVLLAERRTSQERARIARELHDVVAHNVSAIVIQAAAERRDLPAESSTVEVLADIERHGRDTLGELRRLLGVLRADADDAPLSPQPGLADLSALVESARARGVDARLEVEGLPADVGDGLGLAAYRVVQESLTNAGKHARGSRADVRLAWAPDSLRLSVRTGAGGRDRGPAAPGAGYGLRSMADRVIAYGGEFSAGPDDQGFEVRASFPLERVR